MEIGLLADNGKRKIAVDLDGVLFDFLTAFCIFYNQNHGIKVNLKDITNYHFRKIFQAEEKEFRQDMNAFYETTLFKDLKVIEDAQASIKKLAEKNFLGVITSRPDFTSEVTLASLKKNFPGVFSEIHFTSQYGGNGNRNKKSHYCKDHRYEMIIEDVAEYANECAEEGIKVFLITRPWNEREQLHPEVTRVKNWPELLQKLQ